MILARAAAVLALALAMLALGMSLGGHDQDDCRMVILSDQDLVCQTSDGHQLNLVVR